MRRAVAQGLLALGLLASSFVADPAAAGWPGADADAGQVRASNLLLYQVGRDPAVDADPLTEVFNQFNLEYARGAWRVGLRAESFRPSRDEGFIPAAFDEITRKYVDWRGDGLHLRVGSAYATLGRGLLFRAFELPGVVRDAVFPGAKYVDSRDLEGFVAEVDRGPFEATLLAGRPSRWPDNPYGLDEFGLSRREGHVTGGRAGLRPHRAVGLGLGYLRTEGVVDAGLVELGAVDATLRLAPLVPALAAAGAEATLYVEYAARGWRPLSDGIDADDGTPHALYTATELSWGRWGLSFETKDYRDFALGVNDPPNLVPEMRQHLLNRMSHFLLQTDERGHQLSLMGALPGDWTLQAEAAHAVNVIVEPRDYRLNFLGLESPPGAALHGEIFAATGRDEVENITGHTTVGGALDRDLDDRHALHLALEYQSAERELFGETDEFENWFGSLGLSRAGLGSIGVVAEISNDPDEQDDPLTYDVIEDETRRWLGVYATVQTGVAHEATLFAGSRRGGTACTSGTCYLVPDFRGVELRIASRF